MTDRQTWRAYRKETNGSGGSRYRIQKVVEGWCLLQSLRSVVGYSGPSAGVKVEAVDQPTGGFLWYAEITPVEGASNTEVGHLRNAVEKFVRHWPRPVDVAFVLSGGHESD